jgi:hypothetical protein
MTFFFNVTGYGRNVKIVLNVRCVRYCDVTFVEVLGKDTREFRLTGPRTEI